MSKQKCTKCEHDLSWKAIQGSFLRGYRPISCPECGTEHKVKEHSKLIVAVLVAFPPVFFILVLASAFGLTAYQSLLGVFVYLMLIVALIPMIVRYELAENPR
ncbi:TIGR04104 family putative zinc finger protein [Bacillus sp. FJAT-45350]|uniref:TIGR04104 family putative zinc finger protein n=1 Tax=Bacillus sp. FJAT-45350 TaxID=2011014 RepID=UPI0015CD95BC|nr:TIGR04104 family putative zinc finger protein [Bacillus sp. FJAT-45350]